MISCDILQTECRLGLYKVEGENIIINATVWDEDFTETGMRQPNDQLFKRERVCI